MMTLRSRAWCFTINNDTFDDLEKMLDMTFQYLVFGFETGGKKKVCHIQGYVYFNNALSQSSVKKKLPRAHLEPKRPIRTLITLLKTVISMNSVKSPYPVGLVSIR